MFHQGLTIEKGIRETFIAFQMQQVKHDDKLLPGIGMVNADISDESHLWYFMKRYLSVYQTALIALLPCIYFQGQYEKHQSYAWLNA